jgi:serine/threonine-protein kinase RsbW
MFRMRLELRATPQEVMRAVKTLEEFARDQGLSEKAVFGLALALEECASNIVNHAFHCDSQQRFEVLFKRLGDVFLIELRDRGPEFDPTTAPQRKPQLNYDDPPGGWGVQLVRHYLDEIRYRREAGENILSLHKRLDSAAGEK